MKKISLMVILMSAVFLTACFLTACASKTGREIEYKSPCACNYDIEKITTNRG